MNDVPSVRNWAVKSECKFLVIEKRVTSALLANGGDFAVARIDERIVGKLKDFLGEGLHDFFEGTAPEIGTADASGEEGVTGEQLRLAKLDLAGLLGEEKAHTPRSVPGSVEDLGMITAPFEEIAVSQELIDLGEFGGLHTEKSGLGVDGIVEREIVVVHHDRSAGVLMELGEAPDVIDVGVGADDGFDRELVAAKQAKNTFDFVAWVDNDGFASFGIADDGAVALKHADRNFDVDHLRVGGVGAVKRVGHGEKYSIGISRGAGVRQLPRFAGDDNELRGGAARELAGLC